MALHILLTGSQKWVDPAPIDIVLTHYVNQAFALGQRLHVDHGSAAQGADNLAYGWIAKRNRQGWPVDQTRHPADWTGPCVPTCNPGHRQIRRSGAEYCPYAGFRRSDRMVALGQQLCVGFWKGGSSGTRHCLDEAEKAGMRTLKIKWFDRAGYTLDWMQRNAPKLELPQ